MAEKASGKGTADMQKAMDAEQEQGFRGTKIDPTPNEAYTVKGVTSGQATPETDHEKKAAIQADLMTDVGGGQSKMTAAREPGEHAK